MANVNFNLIATADTAQAEMAVTRLKAAMIELQGAYATAGKTTFMQDARKELREFNKQLEETGRFRVHAVNAASAADRLADRIHRNKITWTDFTQAMGRVNKAGSTFLELGKQQVSMLEAQAVRLGKTAYVYQDMTLNFDKTGRAALASARGIAAQNAVLRAMAINVINVGKNMQWTGRQLTMGITMPLAMFGAQTAKIFNEVDQNLTRLAKVYGVGLTQPTEQSIKSIRKEMIGLSQDLAKSLGMTATEVTDIGAQFAAAGLQGKALIAATKQASRMVVLGEADKQEAINATISLQTAYRLNTKELTEAVNFFNAAQAATSTSMGDLINAIPRLGPVIKNLGGNYKDMVAILTALKEGGVPASEAANAIKNSLSRIIAPTTAAQERLKSFGIDLKDIVLKNAGNLSGTIKELQDGLLGLDTISRQQAITELFGRYQSARMTAFIQNFGQAGTQSQKVIEMMGISAVELANIADKQTKRIQESASGRFKIAVETMKSSLLPLGEMFLNTFGWMLEKITDMVKAIQDLPAPLKGFIKLMAGLAAVVGPAVMVGGLIGNMVGSLSLGLVKLKSFGGALKSLFTGGGFEGFKIILGGFKDIDLLAEGATRAVDLFNQEVRMTDSSADIFAAGIDTMILRLKELQDQAGAAATAINTVIPSSQATARQNVKPADTSMTDREKTAFLMTPGLLFPSQKSKASSARFSQDERNLAALRNEIQTAVQDASFHFYDPNTQTRMQAFEQTAKSAGKNISHVAPRITEESLRGIIVSQDEYLASVGNYLTRLNIIEKVGTKKFNSAITALKTVLRTSTDQGEINLAIRAFEQEMGMFDDKFVQGVQKKVEALRKATAGMNDEQLRAYVQSQEEIQLSKLRAQDFLGFKGQKRQSSAIIYSLAGGGADLRDELMRSMVVDKKSETRGVEHHHLTPVADVLKRVRKETLDFINKTVQQTGQSAAQVINNLANSPVAQTGIVEIKATVKGKTQKLLVDLTNGLENVIVHEIDQAGAVIRQLTATEIKALNLKGRQPIQRGLAALNAAANLNPVIPGVAGGIDDLDAEGGINNPEARGRRRGIARGIGAAGMMASTGMMMAGYGNETLNQAMMGVSTASMATSMLPASMAGGPAGVAIFAVIAALPLLISGMQKVIDNASRLGRAMEGAFKTSSAEAEMLNIKLHKFSSYEAPAAGTAAKAAKTEIDSFAESVSNLGEGDPLKTLVDSLKDMSTQNQMEMLQAKYLTLRIQGVDDQEARNFVKAIMKAAGIELQQGGSSVVDYMAEANKNLSISEMVVKNAQNSLRMASQSDSAFLDFNAPLTLSGGNIAAGKLDAGASGSLSYLAENGLASSLFAPIGPGADAARKAVDSFSTTLSELMMTAADNRDLKTLDKQLTEIAGSMKQGTDEGLLFDAAVREIYAKAGLTDMWDKLKNSAMTSADKLRLLQLQANGLADDLDYLVKNPKEITVRYTLLENTQEISSVLDSIMPDLAEKAKQTQYTSKAATAASKATQDQASTQQKIVDKLKEELKLRQEILDSQEKSVQFSNSMASLQQQYNAALSENDLAKAADLQRQMTLEQSKYNNEIEKSALQKQIDQAESKLSKMQKVLEKASQAAETTVTDLKDYSEEILGVVNTALANDGKIAQGELDKIAAQLKSKFGIPVAETEKIIKSAIKALDANDVVDFAQEAGKAFSQYWIPAQQQSAIFSAFTALATKPEFAGKPQDAMAAAIQQVMSISDKSISSVYAKSIGNGQFNYVARLNTGKDREVSLTNNAVTAPAGAATPTDQKTRIPDPGNTSGNIYFDTNNPKRGWFKDDDFRIGLKPNIVTKLEYAAGQKYYQTGGHVTGPGTGTSDSIPAMLSNGEYVIKASSVQKYGKETFDALNTQRFADGGIVTNRKEWENPVNPWAKFDIPKPAVLAIKQSKKGINPYTGDKHNVAGSQLYWDKSVSNWTYGVPPIGGITFDDWKGGKNHYLYRVNRAAEAEAIETLREDRRADTWKWDTEKALQTNLQVTAQKNRQEEFNRLLRQSSSKIPSISTYAKERLKEKYLDQWRESLRQSYQSRDQRDEELASRKTAGDVLSTAMQELVTDVKAAALVPVVGSMLIGGGRAGAAWFGLEKGENYFNENFGVSKDANPLLKLLATTGRFAYNLGQGAASGAAATGIPGLIGGAVFGGLEGIVGIGQSGLDYGTKGGNQAATSKTDFSPETLLNELIMNQALGVGAEFGLRGLARGVKQIKPASRFVKRSASSGAKGIKLKTSEVRALAKRNMPSRIKDLQVKIRNAKRHVQLVRAISYARKNGIDFDSFEDLKVKLGKVVNSSELEIGDFDLGNASFNGKSGPLPPELASSRYIIPDGRGGWKYDIESASAYLREQDSASSMYPDWFFEDKPWAKAIGEKIIAKNGNLDRQEVWDIMKENLGQYYNNYMGAFRGGIDDPQALLQWASAATGKNVGAGVTAETLAMENSLRELTKGFKNSRIKSGLAYAVDPMISARKLIKYGIPRFIRRSKNKFIDKKNRFLESKVDPILFRAFTGEARSEDPALRALSVIKNAVHRSGSKIGDAIPFSDIEAASGIQHGVTRGPGSYFTTNMLGTFSSMYRWFGNNFHRLDLNPELIDEVMSSAGFIEGREKLNQLIEEFNTLTGRTEDAAGVSLSKFSRTVPENAKYEPESGSAARIKGGLRDLSINDPLIQWLMNEKGFLGYQHGQWNQAVVMWKMGMGKRPNGKPIWNFRQIPSKMSLLEDSIKNYFVGRKTKKPNNVLTSESERVRPETWGTGMSQDLLPMSPQQRNLLVVREMERRGLFHGSEEELSGILPRTPEETTHNMFGLNLYTTSSPALAQTYGEYVARIRNSNIADDAQFIDIRENSPYSIYEQNPELFHALNRHLLLPGNMALRTELRPLTEAITLGGLTPDTRIIPKSEAEKIAEELRQNGLIERITEIINGINYADYRTSHSYMKDIAKELRMFTHGSDDVSPMFGSQTGELFKKDSWRKTGGMRATEPINYTPEEELAMLEFRKWMDPALAENLRYKIQIKMNLQDQMREKQGANSIYKNEGAKLIEPDLNDVIEYVLRNHYKDRTVALKDVFPGISDITETQSFNNYLYEMLKDYPTLFNYMEGPKRTSLPDSFDIPIRKAFESASMVSDLENLSNSSTTFPDILRGIYAESGWNMDNVQNLSHGVFSTATWRMQHPSYVNPLSLQERISRVLGDNLNIPVELNTVGASRIDANNFWGYADVLEKFGISGLIHTGGINTAGKPHDVIAFGTDPASEGWESQLLDSKWIDSLVEADRSILSSMTLQAAGTPGERMVREGLFTNLPNYFPGETVVRKDLKRVANPGFLERPETDLSGLEFIGDMAGRSKGKIYFDPESGIKYFIKPTPGFAAARREHGMNRFARKMGLTAPESQIIKIGDQWYIISEELEGFIPLPQAGNAEERIALTETAKFQRFQGMNDVFSSFVGDTDAHAGNIMYNPETGQFARVDFGQADPFSGRPLRVPGNDPYTKSNIGKPISIDMLRGMFVNGNRSGRVERPNSEPQFNRSRTYFDAAEEMINKLAEYDSAVGLVNELGFSDTFAPGFSRAADPKQIRSDLRNIVRNRGMFFRLDVRKQLDLVKEATFMPPRTWEQAVRKTEDGKYFLPSGQVVDEAGYLRRLEDMRDINKMYDGFGNEIPPTPKPINMPPTPKTRLIDRLTLWLKAKKGLYHGGISGLSPSDFHGADSRGWNWPSTYFTPQKFIASSYAMENRSPNPAVYKLRLGLKDALSRNVLNFGRRATDDQKQALVEKLHALYGEILPQTDLERLSGLIYSSKNIDQALSIFRNVNVADSSLRSSLRGETTSFADELFGISSSDAVINFNKLTTQLRNRRIYSDGLIGEKSLADDISQTFIPNLSSFNMSQITHGNQSDFIDNLPGLYGSPIMKFLARKTDGLDAARNVYAATKLHNWIMFLNDRKLFNQTSSSQPRRNGGRGAMQRGTSSILSSLGISMTNSRMALLDKLFGVEGGTTVATGGYINNGKVEIPRFAEGGYILPDNSFNIMSPVVSLPKYHTGGFVNYAYGKEVAAMLEGGEVVVPKEVVRDIQNNHSANNSSSMYNNNVTVNVAGTNASPQEIANAVTEAMQRRQNMTGSRTVVR